MTATAPGCFRDGDVLDCVTGNLAVLLARAGDADPLRLLGGQCTFGLTADPLPLPVLAHTDPLTAFATHRPVDPKRLGSLVAEHGDVLVFADAYALPWLPMCGRQHVEHTVVVAAADGGRFGVLDAYTADTEWGEARPTTAVIGADVLARAMAAHTGAHRLSAVTLPEGRRPRPPEAAEMMRDNARAMTATVLEGATVRGFAEPYRRIGADLDGWRRFELGCWMAARARAAYARWLDSAGASEALVREAAAVAEVWQQTSRLAYVTRRRVAAGRDPGPALADEVATTVQKRERDLAARVTGEARR